MKYSAEELRGLGFDEEQIEAITKVYKKGTEQPVKRTISEVPVSPLFEVKKEEPVRKVAHAADLQVTTIADLQRYARGQLVELPPFADGQPLVVRMKRPSLMMLAKSGKIPNGLMKTASALFNGDDLTESGMPEDEMLEKTYDILTLICEASLVEPSMEDFKEAGIELSDNQMIAIFNYTQQGISALESFRSE